APLKPVTWLSSSPTDLTFEKTASPGGFFCLQSKRLRIAQRNLKKFFILVENQPPPLAFTFYG
ncbi:hypothetical protein, partial [Enterobacter hormaechei]|uniref:hypothetical protein n=1 Tax=Enterobacter hormaechei TaxID=158836 RepID=UPI0023E442B6